MRRIWSLTARTSQVRGFKVPQFPFRLTTMASSHTESKHRNRLADSKSPYLLQHAHNPVNWYPWSEEAFELAKREDKPIFLSVGYSTCHWCHVMERESFVNEEVAKLMNDNFVNIKVDREERPDVDKLYMTFVTAITGSGGWPMSVFLAPNGAPLTGGTYFPPKDMGGSIGFPSILKLVADQWKTNNASVACQGEALSKAIRLELATKSGEMPNVDTAINDAYDHLVDGFDSQYGGFGIMTKFPKPVDLNFLLFASHFYKSKSANKSQQAISIVRKTLAAMARGGIHDHIGGGFHRYAVDRQWRVPHFEKMLYDQGQLLTVYADFYKLTGEFGNIISDIVGYVDSNLTHKEGGFFAAEDAESYPFEGAGKKKEGASFVFMAEELLDWLTPEQYKAFEAYFNIEMDGNAPSSADPRGELRLQNVLYTLDKPIAELAQRVGQSVSEFEDNLKAAKAVVLEKRGQRPAPGLDTKFITSWNSLMISGLCSAYSAFPEKKDYLERAGKALDFIKEYLINSDGRLLRTVYTDKKDGKIVQIPNPVYAFSDDYTFLIQALLDLYQVDFNEDHLKLALKLQNQLDSDFLDPEHRAGYFTNRTGDATLFARFSEDQDGAEPAPNSVAVNNLLRFADLFGDETFREQANWIIKGHAHRFSKHPHTITKMVTAAGRAAPSSMQIVIVAPSRDDPTAVQMLDSIHKKFLPNASIAFITEDVDVKDSLILTKNEHTRELLKATPGATTAYVCENFACGLPANDVFELEARLNVERSTTV